MGYINIFGEREHIPLIEELYCPKGCDYNRVGSRETERFRCHYCKSDMINETELAEMEAYKNRKDDDASLKALTDWIVRGNG